jgi:hypothetical protein
LQGQLELVRVALGEADAVLHQPREELVERRHRAGHVLGERADRVGHQKVERRVAEGAPVELLLGAEVREQRLLGDARLGRDVGGGRAVEAVGRELDERGGEDALLRVALRGLRGGRLSRLCRRHGRILTGALPDGK